MDVKNRARDRPDGDRARGEAVLGVVGVSPALRRRVGLERAGEPPFQIILEGHAEPARARAT